MSLTDQHYSIHDRDTIHALLQQQVTAQTMAEYGREIEHRFGRDPEKDKAINLEHGREIQRRIEHNLTRALLLAQKKYDRHCGNTSKYRPHQGQQERDRRATR